MNHDGYKHCDYAFDNLDPINKKYNFKVLCACLCVPNLPEQ